MPLGGVVGPADALQEGGEAARRSRSGRRGSTGPDVNAEFERGAVATSAPQVPAAQPGLHSLPAFLRQAPVVAPRQRPSPSSLARAHARSASAIRRVLTKHDRRPVLVHMAGDEVDDLGHLLRGRHGPRARLTAAPGRGLARAGGRESTIEQPRRSIGFLNRSGPGTDEKPGHGRRSAAGVGRQPYALDGLLRDMRQSLKGSAPGASPACCRRTAWISSTMTVVAERSHRAPGPFGSQQKVEGLGGGYEEIRRLLQHRGAFRAAAVSPVRTANLDRRRGQAEFGGHFGDLSQRPPRGSARYPRPGAFSGETYTTSGPVTGIIAWNLPPQGRSPSMPGSRPACGLMGPVEPVDAHEEGCERLT